MKYLTWAGFLVVGIGIGYLMGTTVPVDDNSPVATTEFIKETVHDTIIQTETVEIPVVELENDSLTETIDSLTEILDTALVLTEVSDTSASEEISIRTEKMVGYRWLTVTVIKEEEQKDSLIKEMMDIKDSWPSKLKVEFWESPLNFNGYKLSRSKLVMYGMPSQMTYQLFRKGEKYYLSTQSVYYSLRETEEFLPYLEVSKQEVFND